MNNIFYWCLLLVILCLLLTTIFSALTLSLRHIAWSKLEEQFNRQKKSYRTLIIRAHQTPLIYTTSALCLIINLGLSLAVTYYYLESPDVHPPLTMMPLIKALVVCFLLLVVFSLFIPNLWARKAGAALIAQSYSFLCVLTYIAEPFTRIISWLGHSFEKLLDIPRENISEILDGKKDELQRIILESERENIIDAKERQMIESVLEFGATTTEDIMTARTQIAAINVNTPLPEVIQFIISRGQSRYPVYVDTIDNIIGLLYAKDLLHDLPQPAASSDIRGRLRKAYFVSHNKSVRELLDFFQAQKVHLAIVLDEYGGTAGLVTIEDILEEIVGEIIDEYEQPVDEALFKIDDHTLEVDARYEVDKLNNEFHLNLPEDKDYESIGGFVVSVLGTIPRPGYTFTYKNLDFIIMDAGLRKVNRLRLVIHPEISERESNNTQI